MFQKKYRIPAIVIICTLLGFTSATILARYNYFVQKHVNIFASTKNECPDVKWNYRFDSTQASSPVSIDGELYFAGERVPLEDPDVRERLERELQLNVYWHSNTLLSMKLANRHFDEIEAILKKNNVPTDFKYLALIESNFRYEASPAGAVGFWQFMKATATTYNLKVDDEVDERYNTEKSTEAACAFLKDAKDKLGNWTIAAGSYNLGLPAMGLRIKDQKTNNYYDMYFNPETSRYIFRMLAMKIIFSNPKRAGYALNADELYQPYKYKVVEVDSTISNIADFAEHYGLRYKHIKMLNPWLRAAKLTNKERKKYQVKILDLN
ncbi:MAG: hypothetical protein JWO06_3689 [Bacteroidota bacterium]|nr:hypothetical protein [Bacteroidota bacterium]